MVTRVIAGMLLLAAAGCQKAPPPPEARKIQWKQLRGLDVRTGRIPDDIRELDGKPVKIAGYMLPRHEDTGFQMKEFLLVPYPNASSDYPPPPQNETVLVKMAGDRTMNYSHDPLWIEGRLTISPTKSLWGPVTYQLTATGTEPYTE